MWLNVFVHCLFSDSGAAEVYSIISSRSEDLLMELASDLGLHKDPVKLKEQVSLV